MTSIFYIAAAVAMIVFQTGIRPSIDFLSGFYDLLTLMVIYVSLFRPLREAVPVLIFVGFLMDNLSGGPFGIYLTTYLWLFLMIQLLMRYLRVGNTLLLPIVIVVGVLLQNLIFLATIAFLTPGTRVPDGAASMVFRQMLWAAFTGVFVIALLEFGRKKWENRYVQRAGK